MNNTLEGSTQQQAVLDDRSMAPAGVRAPHESGVGAWIDERTGINRTWRELRAWRIPTYAATNVLYALGGLTLASLLFQMVSGCLLAFYYDPSAADAYNSVDYIMYQVPLGWLIRGIHHYNAGAIVLLVFAHTLRTFFYSTYKRPREITWLSGVFLLLVALGFGFTGYLLPWDQKGYWATVVSTQIADKVPLVGETISHLMKGGATLGQLTLTRFYVVHVAILPVTIILLILVHLQQVRRHGIAPSITKRGRAAGGSTVPWYPSWLGMVALLALGLLAILVFLSWRTHAPLEYPADPSSTDYNPRPEWYFLFLFQLLSYAPGAWEPYLIVLVPAVVIGSMIVVPFIDRGEERRPWRKPITTTIAVFYVAVIIIFTAIAW
ncbi:MAG: cytochrome b N-terminal domain-containing protein [Caldilineaceae bacterium]